MRIRGREIFLVALSAFLSPQLFAGDQGSSFEGIVSATLTPNGAKTQYLFTRKENQLRIENADKITPEPINIVDLRAKSLTIIFPHNSTFAHLDLTKAPAQPAALVAPPMSPMPSIPQLPNNSGGTTMPAMPMMPAAMPAMPDTSGNLQLKKTDKTKKILGYDCFSYTVSDGGQTFEIWAVPDSDLFPFRLLQSSLSERHFGPQRLEDRWVALLQKKSLFPLEATLRVDPGQTERVSFKVDKIDPKKIEDSSLFKVPEAFYEIKPPEF